jgi:3',5'-cyclic AMP phosphodiesterase CpdA
MDKELPIRTSKIKKSVSILINTGDYTNITVMNEYEETIEWKDKKDRMEKENSILNLLLENMANDINKVLEFTNRKNESTVIKGATKSMADSSSMGLSDLGEGEAFNG